MSTYKQADVIYETENMVLRREPRPHISREEGGHLKISAKRDGVRERRDLTPREAVEMAWLSSVAGQAMEVGLKKRGIPIVKINYQENGNWAAIPGSEPTFHLHLYGRSSDAKVQKFPNALHMPIRADNPDFYKDFIPFIDEDVEAIRDEIENIIKTEKYANKAEWRLRADD